MKESKCDPFTKAGKHKCRKGKQMKDKAVRLTTHPDGSIEPLHVWLCTGPIHYRNILVDVTMHYTSDPGSRFVHENLPLSKVNDTLDIRGF